MTATRPTRIRPGLYDVTIEVEGKPVTFTVERTERGDTGYAGDVGLWRIHTPHDQGEPAYPTLRDALAVITPAHWYFDRQYGLCAWPAPKGA